MANEVSGETVTHVSPLLFGIPQLDELLGHDAATHDPGANGSQHGYLQRATSLTIVGQNGTGKSILALHIASTYHARVSMHNEFRDDNPLAPPMVVYLSSDLSYAAASKTWLDFGLDQPLLNYVPFPSATELQYRRLKQRAYRINVPAERRKASLQIALTHCAPISFKSKDAGGAVPVLEFLSEIQRPNEAGGQTPAAAQVGFIDLNAHTAGDDWLLAVRLVASINPTQAKSDSAAESVPGLLIVDSIEGFETLIGEQNSFGERMSRRARIAQLIRAARERWHIVFLTEQPEPGKHHPEEYVTDTVISVKRQSRGELVRRILEIEKCRGRSFGSGEHPFEIRPGPGTSTGDWENPDDPHALANPELDHGERGPKTHAYVQVFPSLNYLSREVAANVALNDPIDKKEADIELPFGLPHLDEMLWTRKQDARREVTMLPSCSRPRPTRGLQSGTVTSLIGDGGTRKEVLAEQFVLHAFTHFSLYLDFALSLVRAWKGGDPVGPKEQFSSYVRRRLKGLGDTLRPATDGSLRLASTPASLAELEQRLHERVAAHWLGQLGSQDKALDSIAADRRYRPKPPPGIEGTGPRPRHLGPLKPRWDFLEYAEPGTEIDEAQHSFLLALTLLRLKGGLLTPIVLVTTKDITAGNLSDVICTRQCADINQLLTGLGVDSIRQKSSEPSTAEWHIRRLVERFMVVRRVDNIDLTAPQLWQIISSSVRRGLDLLGSSNDEFRELRPSRGAAQIRVVVSDLRLFRDVYPDVTEDPLFLSMLIFRLRRFGVTALLVDTDASRPDKPQEPSNLSIRSMVDCQLFTWKVPFFGEERVAISISPPTDVAGVGVIRELRTVPPAESDRASPDRSALVVDPHFELYAEVEEGRPAMVPLRVSIWAETPAFTSYADEENKLLSRLFRGLNDSNRVIDALDTAQYHSLRDYTNLPNDTRQAYTHVFAIDGHWSLNRDAALRKQAHYLFTPLHHGHKEIRDDPFGLWPIHDAPEASESAHAIEWRAKAFIQRRSDDKFYYKSRICLSESVDRVPFTWDFGFLVCDQNMWKHYAKLAIPGLKTPERARVGEVWRAMHRVELSGTDEPPREGFTPRRRAGDAQTLEMEPVPASASGPVVDWRQFLGACQVIAAAEAAAHHRKVLAFDLAASTPGAILCFLLEVWMSEVVRDSLRLKKAAERCRSSVTAATPAWRKAIEFAEDWVKTSQEELCSLSAEYYRGMRTQNATQPANRLARFFCGDDLKASTLKTVYGEIANHGIELPPQEYACVKAGVEEADLRMILLQCKMGRSFSLQLYKAWLLISEVMDLDRYKDDSAPGHFKHDYRPAVDTVASRHWYKTACAAQQAVTPQGAACEKAAALAMVPMRLPGHFSIRGDWFLAVSKGSRSSRLADLALDIMTSRRANRTRLEMGLGLPTRDLVHGDALGHVRTGLSVGTPNGRLSLSYRKLLWLAGGYMLEAVEGADEPEGGTPSASNAGGIASRPAVVDESGFYWLFRSGFEDFYRYEPLLLNWVARLLSWTSATSLRQRGAMPVGTGFAQYDALDKGDWKVARRDSSFLQFPERVDWLCEELRRETAAGGRRAREATKP